VGEDQEEGIKANKIKEVGEEMIQAFTIMFAVYFIVRLIDTCIKTESGTVKAFTWLGILVIIGCVIAVFAQINDMNQILNGFIN